MFIGFRRETVSDYLAVIMSCGPTIPLAERPQIVLATKTDALEDPERLAR